MALTEEQLKDIALRIALEYGQPHEAVELIIGSFLAFLPKPEAVEVVFENIETDEWHKKTLYTAAPIAQPASAPSEQKPDGQWVRCTPELIHAGVCCDKTPRRPGDGSYSHDHFISHAAPQPAYKGQRDAERYRWLRNSENQLTEDDPCVSDSFFNTWFGEELDKVIDEMIARDAAITSVKGGER